MSTQRKSWTVRRVHLWIGISLAIPMALMAITGILISMRGITAIDVPMSWSSSEAMPKHLPVSAYVETSDGTMWLGNAQGLNSITAAQVQVIKQFAGQEIVALAALPNHQFPIVATKMAVWSENNGNWQAVMKGRVRQLSTFANGQVFAIAGGRGELADGKPMITADGQQWQPYQAPIAANNQLPDLENPRIPLHQLMREIHSGAFWFGKGIGEMMWSNVLGWILVGLSLTGLWVWLKVERQKAAKRIKFKTNIHSDGGK